MKCFDYNVRILEYLIKFSSANRQVIDKLITDKLPDFMNAEQKRKKVGNLLASLRKDNKIITFSF